VESEPARETSTGASRGASRERRDGRRATKRASGLACGALLSALALLDQPARAADPDEEPKPGAVDPGVAPGPPVVYSARPVFHPDLRACSARVPVCVHAKSARDGAAAVATLGAFERAWQILTGSLALPPPDVDPTTLAYDVFLVDALDHPRDLASTELEARDVRSRIDRARAFTRVDRRVRPGCMLDAIAAESIARASIFRTAPATNEATARAQSVYLSQLAFPCAVALSGDAVSAFQSRADRTLCDGFAGDDAKAAGEELRPRPSPLDALFAAGAATFWARLEWAFGRTPGGIVTASWSLSPTMTPLGAARWMNEPDTFDVLRASFKNALTTGSTVNDLWLDFGVARAFLGSADDGLHFPELRTLGDAALVPVDWDIPWPTKPRRLAPRRPAYPTGASYLVVRRAGAPPGARLRAEIEWETHALFRWAFVKLDADGHEIGRVVIPTTERATQAQMTLVDLDAVDRVMLVGVNVGDPAYAFDPDDEVWEPHGWMVTIAEER
jgi:hypothetical protein